MDLLFGDVYAQEKIVVCCVCSQVFRLGYAIMWCYHRLYKIGCCYPTTPAFDVHQYKQLCQRQLPTFDISWKMLQPPNSPHSANLCEANKRYNMKYNVLLSKNKSQQGPCCLEDDIFMKPPFEEQIV